MLVSDTNRDTNFWRGTKSFWKNKVARIVPKSYSPSVIKRVLTDYKLRRSKKTTKPKLTDKSIQYVIEQLEKGADTKTVAKEMRVTQRHIQRLWMEYRNKGKIHLQGKAGRPAKAVLPEEVKVVLDAYASRPAGVLQITKDLNNRISHRRVYQIMKSNGLITPSHAKTKKRKRGNGHKRI